MKKIFLSSLIILQFLGGNLFSQTPEYSNFTIVGAQAGLKNIQGFYKNELDDGYFLEIYSIFPFPNLFWNPNRYLSGDANITYSNYALAESKSSSLITISLKMGPMLIYPVFKYLNLFAGVNIGFDYLYLTARETNISNRTYKASYSAKTGILIPFDNNLIIRTGVEYCMFELSNEIFHDIKYGISAAYNIKFYDDKEITGIRSALKYDTLYDEAVELFKNGNGKKAGNIFKKIEDFDEKYRDVRNYLEIIKNNEEKYNQALKLIREKKFGEAIPLLVETEKYFIEAKNKLNETRKMLSNEIKAMEELAIKAYDNKEYEECINILNKIKMIDPANETYNLYYPKAVSRNKAIKLLE